MMGSVVRLLKGLKGYSLLCCDLGELLRESAGGLRQRHLSVLLPHLCQKNGHVVVDSVVTECIVCVPGHDPLTFLSCPFPF